jgi:cytochrome c556
MTRGGLILAPLLLAGCATVPQGPVPGLGPAEIVAARGAAFQLSAATLGSMKRVIDADGDVKSQAFAARGLARWGRAMPALFPEVTRGLESRARPELWTGRADFTAKAAAFEAAATRLAEAAQAGDKAAFASQWQAVDASCSACHDLYRAPPPAPAR